MPATATNQQQTNSKPEWAPIPTQKIATEAQLVQIPERSMQTILHKDRFQNTQIILTSTIN